MSKTMRLQQCFTMSLNHFSLFWVMTHKRTSPAICVCLLSWSLRSFLYLLFLFRHVLTPFLSPRWFFLFISSRPTCLTRPAMTWCSSSYSVHWANSIKRHYGRLSSSFFIVVFFHCEESSYLHEIHLLAKTLLRRFFTTLWEAFMIFLFTHREYLNKEWALLIFTIL